MSLHLLLGLTDGSSQSESRLYFMIPTIAEVSPVKPAHYRLLQKQVELLDYEHFSTPPCREDATIGGSLWTLLKIVKKGPLSQMSA